MPESRWGLQLHVRAERLRRQRVARSAAGCCALYYSGVFEGDNLKKGLDYIKNSGGPGGGGGGSAAAMASTTFTGTTTPRRRCFLAGGDYWAGF